MSKGQIRAVAAVFAAVLAFTGSASKGQVKVIPDIYDPEMIAVAADELIVVEGAAVSVFSLPGLELRIRFGRPGQGPGELTTFPFWSNAVRLLPDAFMVDTMNSVHFFSRDGTFLSYLPKPPGIRQITRIPSGFVGLDNSVVEDGVHYQVVLLFDPKLGHRRELARQPAPEQRSRRSVELPLDCLNFSVWEDRIYIEKSREGFRIDVFDGTGGKLREIKKDIPRIPIDDRAREVILARLEDDPGIARGGGLDNVFRQWQVTYSDCWPAITDLLIADGRIYARTSDPDPGHKDFLVLDLEGRSLGRMTARGLPETDIVDVQLGVRLYAISGGRLVDVIPGETETILRVQDLPMQKIE